jgi:hypothetical protein
MQSLIPKDLESLAQELEEDLRPQDKDILSTLLEDVKNMVCKSINFV